MKCLFEVLVEAVQGGLTLSVRGDRLAVAPDSLLTPDLADRLREHKSELLRLLSLTFLVVESHVLDQIVFFVPDDETKDKLVGFGAQRGSIYTRAELAVLVQGRTTADELRRIHEAKEIFSGRITP